MFLLKVVGILLKYELNELAITSGSLIMMPFSLMDVLGDLRILPRMVVVVGQTVGSISSKTLAYDCLYTLELCTASMIAPS